MTRNPTPPAITRRQCVGLSIAGAMTGATWATGLGVLARGMHPQFQVIGDKGWQIVLIEHGSARLAILLGHFTSDPGPGLDFLATSLRQHVDVIAGERHNLNRLDWEHPKWRTATRVVLGESGNTPVSGQEIQPPGALAVSVGDWTVTVGQDVRDDWRTPASPTWTWVARAACGDIEVMFGNDLWLASNKRSPSTVLLIAPVSGPIDLSGHNLRTSVAVNVASLDTIGQDDGDNSNHQLVRIFPEDIATFRVTDGRLLLPDWATPE